MTGPVTHPKRANASLEEVNFEVNRLPEIEIFEHENFRGASYRTSLDVSNVGSWWNDKASSVIVYSGTWAIYEHENYGGANITLTPGQYANPSKSHGFGNDTLTSFKLQKY
jgi:beta/gamma crystallin